MDKDFLIDPADSRSVWSREISVQLPDRIGHLIATPNARRCAGLAGAGLVLVLIVLGLFGPVQRDPHAINKGGGDIDFYARVVEKVHAGWSYDRAAVEDLRENDGALRPFVTVRPPLLAVAMAALPNTVVRVLSVRLLAVGVLIAWFMRLSSRGQDPRYLWPMLLAQVTGVTMAFAPQAYLLHETWAGLLIALSLALRTPERWLASVGVATVAVLIRELAAPYLLAMLALALFDRRPKEALGWLAGLIIFGVALARHAAAVQVLLTPNDQASLGWFKLGGWPFVLHAMTFNIVGLLLPPRVLGVLFPLALLGLATWRGALGRRVALTVGGYVFAFLFVGRPGNFYWGLMIAPLWPLGLALAPAGVAVLWSVLKPGSAASLPPRPKIVVTAR